MAANERAGTGGRAELLELAELYGVMTSYDDAVGRRRDVPRDAVLEVLRTLGAAVEGDADISDAVRERRQAVWRRPLEPVCVVWDGGPAVIDLRLPTTTPLGTVECLLTCETGEERRLHLLLGAGLDVEAESLEGVAYVRKRVTVADRVPFGRHRLAVDLPGGRVETTLLSAPTRSYAPRGRGWERTWGTFLPLYSLRSRRSWGAGDFGDLRELAAWTNGLGGGVVGTLPLMAAFPDECYEISPYSPVSRLFWNEFYLDVEAVPEVAASESARELMRSGAFAAELKSLRDAPLVDYRRQSTLQRRVLEEAAQSLFASSSDRRTAFEKYVAEHPHAADYAAFRAVGERLRTPWFDWPETLRDGSIGPADCDESAKRFHLFAQWLADEQLLAAADAARAGGGFGLYLDLPLGVNAAGYDTWRERRSFALGAAGGAPPDPGFPKGQNWGFVPLHPQGVREDGYRYVSAFLRHQLRFAGVLRIDHMPSFHRVFWIPPGRDASSGAYVRYNADELYAVFSLESHRHRSVLVGEDLGTVPPEVPLAMARHGVHRMYVAQYEMRPDPGAALPSVPAEALACVNTHDMPPFAAFRDGRDVAERVALGLIEPESVGPEEASRRLLREGLDRFLDTDETAAPAAVHRAVLERFRDGPARVVLVNLEDLWSETQPQNVPSTAGEESPNWRRKARHAFEEFTQRPDVTEPLRSIASGFGDRSGG